MQVQVRQVLQAGQGEIFDASCAEDLVGQTASGWTVVDARLTDTNAILVVMEGDVPVEALVEQLRFSPVANTTGEVIQNIFEVPAWDVDEKMEELISEHPEWFKGNGG